MPDSGITREVGLPDPSVRDCGALRSASGSSVTLRYGMSGRRNLELPIARETPGLSRASALQQKERESTQRGQTEEDEHHRNEQSLGSAGSVFIGVMCKINTIGLIKSPRTGAFGTDGDHEVSPIEHTVCQAL